jgi:glycosyltransferase involved in cell wall biosynthesis
MAKKISAVVCVYNREDTLPQCLEALAQQTISTDLFEVIVVDNNSTDGSPEIAAKYAAKYPHMRVVRETKQGLASARNCGMREAKSPIAAFTDDDAIPAKDWAERLLQRFDELGESAAVVGGELDPVWSSPKPDWLQGDKLLHSLSVCLGWSTHARYLIGSEWLCEANSAYRIAPVQERGGFPENLGRIGTNLLSGENAINAVLVRDGYRFFFDPEIRVQPDQQSAFKQRLVPPPFLLAGCDDLFGQSIPARSGMCGRSLRDDLCANERSKLGWPLLGWQRC